MPFPFMAAALLGSAAIGGISSMLGANSAASSSEEARRQQKKALKEQRRQYDTSREDLQPYAQAGYGVMDDLGVASGQGDEAANEDYLTRFRNSPLYQATFQPAYDEAMKQITNRYSGSGQTSAMLQAFQERAADIANRTYGQYYGQQFGLAGLGANAAAGQANNAMQAGNNFANTYGNIGNAAQGVGDAQAAGYMGVGNASSNALSNYAYMEALKRGQGSSSYDDAYTGWGGSG